MKQIELIIDGKAVSVPEGTTILQAARAADIDIPTLCAYEGLKPKAACRLCQVEVEGEDKPKLACAVKIKSGMSITTDSDELNAARKKIVENMFRQHTVDCHHCMRIGSTKAEHFNPEYCESCFFCDCVRDGFCELQSMALRFGIDKLPFEIHEHDFGIDCSAEPVIRNMDKCIRCRRCIEVCEKQGVGILGIRKSEQGDVVASEHDMLTDGCIRCGCCVDACPTGALYMREHKDEIVYYAHQPGIKTAALLCSDVTEQLKELYGVDFSDEQVAAALKKIGIDHVFDGRYAEAISRAAAKELIDRHLGNELLILTNDYSVKTFFRNRYPHLEGNFAFYDSPQKVYADEIRPEMPYAKLIMISAVNSDGAETIDGGAADYFVNPRELFRIFLRTGGAPHRRIPVAMEGLKETRLSAEYANLLGEKKRDAAGGPEEVVITKDGKEYKGLICFNLKQATAAVDHPEGYDVIRVV